MRQLFFLFLTMLLLIGCGTADLLPTIQPTAVLPPQVTPPATLPPPTIPPTFTPTPTPAPLTIGLQTAVPTAILTAAQATAADQPQQFRWTGEAEADLHLTVDGGTPLASWTLAIVAPFATVQDAISLAEVQEAWQTGTLPLLTVPETAVFLSTLWGDPHPAVQTFSADTIWEQLWAARPAIGVIGAELLRPELKTLMVDGQSPLQQNFASATYPLQMTIGVEGEETAVSQFMAAYAEADGPRQNWDSRQHTRIALSGVTALVRATAYQMEINGILYPGQEVRDLFRNADIAHLSNEVSFNPNCPYPNPIGGTSFCSRDSYFALLEDLGIDVVELTGNHLNDFGTEHVTYSLERYAAAGMATFGGGNNGEDAQKAAVFEHNGNRIAFVGCNDFGPVYAWASGDRPGSRPCDETVTAQVSDLTAQGYLVITTLQYAEFYFYEPTAQQRLDFRTYVEAGASAVSGSQGHHAQGFDFHQGGFIHFGLGNLFFDQMDQLGTRQTFIDIYHVHNGKLVSVELWTGLIENFARPRLMTPAERQQLLETTFRASGW